MSADGQPTKSALAPKDVAAATPRGLNSVYDALQSGLLDGIQTAGRRSACWVITPAAVTDWVSRGCPIPPVSHTKKPGRRIAS